ncbi:hypothetical protein Fsol_00324 [Candidatus Fokinia solitaria]|uniref:Uncharacterized protein n=1 Tax=Candidatus Fokinia solitaria TaxID=1802984 RepID=A0A2U8BS07_9RICK|nr:hypothetical protein Fsol_00324 [Candidatus Fokinia solitaria]
MALAEEIRLFESTINSNAEILRKVVEDSKK